MMEQVELLEQHIETLLKLLESAKSKIGELAQENGGLKAQAEKMTGDLKSHIDKIIEVEAQNEELQAQIGRLEEEIEGRSTRESQIRDRLCTILNKIDSIETELTSAGSAN